MYDTESSKTKVYYDFRSIVNQQKIRVNYL